MTDDPRPRHQLDILPSSPFRQTQHVCTTEEQICSEGSRDKIEQHVMASSSKGKHREPPPTLFLGPPSQNTSHVSLSPALGNSSKLASGPSDIVPGIYPRVPLSRQQSARIGVRSDQERNLETGAGLNLPRQLPRQQQAIEGQKQADRTDALWAEMQSTLEEVELSATHGTHVFGAEHGKALEELRAAQIALAQAWARSEADDALEAAEKESKLAKAAGRVSSAGRTSDGTRSKTDSGRPGSSGSGTNAAESLKMEQETESDILLARKRREANDRYFQKVNAGVLDVVAKLETVAIAMKAVEQESREIWGDTDSMGSA